MNTKMVDITPENTDQLIAMPEQEAMAIFSRMTTDQQVALVSSAGNAQRAEQMLFLKPDSSDLIRELPAVVVAEIADYQLETTPDHILESVTPQQVLEIADSEWWLVNNTVDQKQAERWLESIIFVDNPRKGEVYQILQDYLVLLFMGKVGFHVVARDASEVDDDEATAVRHYPMADVSNIDIKDISAEDEDYNANLLARIIDDVFTVNQTCARYVVSEATAYSRDVDDMDLETKRSRWLQDLVAERTSRIEELRPQIEEKDKKRDDLFSTGTVTIDI